MSDPTSFPQFPLLPTELRLRIWHLCLSPRVIEIKYHPKRCEYTARTTPPPLLHVNREARQEIQQIYTLCFQPPTYINYDLDTIYFRNNYGANPLNIIFDEIPQHSMRNLKYFAIDPLFIIGVWDVCISKRWWQVFDELPNLKTVFVVINGEDLRDETGRLTLSVPEGRDSGPSWAELIKTTMDDWKAFSKRDWGAQRPGLEFVSVDRV
jgi:hypothetical protein